MKMKISYGELLDNSFELDVPENIRSIELTNVIPVGMKPGQGNPDFVYRMYPR